MVTHGQQIDGRLGQRPTVTLTADTSWKKVGKDSLCIEVDGGNGECWYNSDQNMAWDFTSWNDLNIPTLNFYACRSDAITTLYIMLYTNVGNFYYYDIGAGLTNVDTWYHSSLPLGPYYQKQDDKSTFRWSNTGNPNWANINWLSFYQASLAGRYVNIDGLWIGGGTHL